MMNPNPAPPRLTRFEDLAFVPRFEHGDMAQLAAICGADDGTPLGVGIARMGNACMDWTVTYDEVLIVLSGQLTVRTTDTVMIAGPHDSIWLPAGTSVTYEAEDCVAAYAIHPASGNPTPASGQEE